MNIAILVVEFVCCLLFDFFANIFEFETLGIEVQVSS